VARAGLGLSIGYGLSLAGSVLSLALYAHLLGPQAYGRLAVYLALVEAFQSVVFQWHRLAFVRYWTASSRADGDTYLVTSHIVWLGLTFVSLIVFAAALGLGVGKYAEWGAVGALALAKCAALYTLEIARAATAVYRYAVGCLLLTFGATGAGCVAWQSTQSMAVTLWATAAVFGLQALLCGGGHGAVFSRTRFDAKQFRTMLNYGLPLVPVFMATTAMTRLDRPILAAFEEPGVVGVYAAASGLVANAVAAACLFVVTPCYPWLLREQRTRSIAEHRTFHARLGLLMLAGVLAVCVAIVLSGDVTLPLMLGYSIGTAAQPLVLPLLAIGAISSFRAHFFDQTYHLHARTKTLMRINLMTLVVAACAVYVGASSGGCRGMLHGILAANVVALVTSATFVRRLVDMRRIVTGAALLCAVAAISIWGGLLSRMPMEHVFHDASWATCISALVGVALFAAMYLGSNIGSIRSALRGRL
jgi:O-antigen/teichoic acid export membrane protein